MGSKAKEIKETMKYVGSKAKEIKERPRLRWKSELDRDAKMFGLRN